MEKHFTDVGNEIIDRVGCHGIGLHSQPYSIYLLKVIKNLITNVLLLGINFSILLPQSLVLLVNEFFLPS
jgi:hypothetical protein